MCFCSGYPFEGAPLRCHVRFTGASSTMSFRFRVQNYYNYLTYANFWAKKMTFTPLFRKRTNKKFMNSAYIQKPCTNKKSTPGGMLNCDLSQERLRIEISWESVVIVRTRSRINVCLVATCILNGANPADEGITF